MYISSIQGILLGARPVRVHTRDLCLYRHHVIMGTYETPSNITEVRYSGFQDGSSTKPRCANLSSRRCHFSGTNIQTSDENNSD